MTLVYTLYIPHSVLARICLFSKIGVIFFLKGVICKTRELFFSAKIVPLCAQISRTMPPSKHLRNMRGPYLFTEPLNNKSSSPINCALPPLCATIYYVQIMEHIQHNYIRYQSQIQDFPKEAAPFVSSAKSTRFSGGVVAEFFCGLRKPTRFSGGGSSRHFSVVPKSVPSKSRRDSVGGG